VTLHLRFFDGGNAVSDFKVQQLLPRLQAVSDKITGLSARFVHLASFDAAPDAATVERLGQLLTYGEPATDAFHVAEKAGAPALYVLPRLGTVSPWASKATDIAHNCGLGLHRVERLVEFRIGLKSGLLGKASLSDEELRAAGVSDAELNDPNYVKASLVLPDMEMFDAEFFGFSKRDAAILDPQHRHFIECAWEALEDAGHPPEKFEGAIGVFGGCGMQAYLPYNLLTNPELKKSVGLFLLRHTGNDKDFLSTRVSYLLDLKGPSLGIQTACSTSLVAVHVAAQSLLAGECDMALAGASSIELPHRQGYRFAEGEIMAPDGHCRAFDESASGTLFGSGAAVVVLRRLEDAVRDRDNIYAIIRGSAVNNDGSQKAGYLAPSVDGQARAAVEALAVANVEPASVQYIEAHGTGTPVGDPIEIAALTQAYGDGGKGFCGIGSVKTNIGHLDTAAGVASLIKVSLALRNELIPQTVNFTRPNSRFDLDKTPFRVVDQPRTWARGQQPRRSPTCP